MHALPNDILFSTLLATNLSTLSKLCSTESRMRTICNNDYFWQQRFERDFTMDPDYIPAKLAQTWQAKYRLLHSLQGTHNIYTLTIDGDDPFEVISSFSTNDEWDTYSLIASLYNEQVEPIFSLFEPIIGDFDDLADVEIEPNDIQLIIEGNISPITTFKLEENKLYTIKPHHGKIITLQRVYDDVKGNVVASFAGIDESQIYDLIAFLVNKGDPNFLFIEYIIDDIIRTDPNWDFGVLLDGNDIKEAFQYASETLNNDYSFVVNII